MFKIASHLSIVSTSINIMFGFTKISLLLATSVKTVSVVQGAEMTGYIVGKYVYITYAHLPTIFFVHKICTYYYNKSSLIIYLSIDNLCLSICEGSDGPCAPDGSNTFFTPELHTGW